MLQFHENEEEYVHLELKPEQRIPLPEEKTPFIIKVLRQLINYFLVTISKTERNKKYLQLYISFLEDSINHKQIKRTSYNNI